jgi:hypothetical protein
MKKMIYLPTVGKSIQIDEKRFSIEIELDPKDQFETEETQILKIKYEDGYEVELGKYGYYEDSLVALSEVTDEINKSFK